MGAVSRPANLSATYRPPESPSAMATSSTINLFISLTHTFFQSQTLTCVFAMVYHFPIYPLFSFLFIGFCILSAAQSSTIGVSYISRLLEIHDRERAPPSVQVDGARGVLARLLPSHSSSFDFAIISKVVLSFTCLLFILRASTFGHLFCQVWTCHVLIDLFHRVDRTEISSGLWDLK